MGVSIYYNFTSEKDLSEMGVLSDVSDQWDEEFADDPYETWTWYEPEKEDEQFVFAGATKLPLDGENVENCVFKAVKLLSALRNEHGGDNWSVNLDDYEIPWDEDEAQFILE